MYLLYGNLITKILEHTRFNFGEEESVEYVKIGEAFLTTMKCKIIDGKVIKKLSNKNKRNVNDQEAPVDLEDFEYIIP